MQKRKEDRVFKHYFIMYFFVLLIPMIICCTYYSYMFFVINEDDISSRKNDLVHAAARFDAVASETVRLADSLVSKACLLYTSPSPRDGLLSRMPSSA